MGGSASKEQKVSKASNSNGKTINLLIEICSSWGYDGKVKNVKSTLINELNTQGYDVDYNFEPKSGGKGEFYVFAIKDGKKRCVFANSKNVAEGNTVVGSNVSKKNLSDIVQNCLSL